MTTHSQLREKICNLNIDLQRYGLVAWTSGNVSERLEDGKSFMIKPSGVKYEELKPSQMIICDLDGKVLEGELAPDARRQFQQPRQHRAAGWEAAGGIGAGAGIGGGERAAEGELGGLPALGPAGHRGGGHLFPGGGGIGGRRGGEFHLHHRLQRQAEGGVRAIQRHPGDEIAEMVHPLLPRGRQRIGRVCAGRSAQR